MRNFILKTIYIILPILVVTVLMETLLRKIPNDYILKREYLDLHASEIETLILGSSHTYRGLDPAYFTSNTFNAGYSSQSLIYDFEIFKKYQSKFDKLNTVVLPISYFSLFGKLENGSEKWRVKNYVIYYDITVSKSLSNSFEIFGSPVKTNIDRIISYYVSKKIITSSSELGWGKRIDSSESKDLIMSGKTAADRHTKEVNSVNSKTVFDENIQAVNAILKWCKENDVKVVLLTTPTFETYYRNLSSEQLNLTIQTATSLSEKYDNCIYLNLLTDRAFDADDFYDADHLQHSGAKKLSILINDEINKLE